MADIKLSELHLAGPDPHWMQPSERVKNGHDHIVPLCATVVALIRRAKEIAPEQSPYLFPSSKTGEPAAAKGLHHALRIAFADRTTNVRGPKGFHVSAPQPAILKCPPFTVHDLRRTAATGMSRLGIDRLIVSKTFNHRSADRTVTGLIYDRYDYLAEKRDALTRWAAHVAKLEAGLRQPDTISRSN